MDTILLTTQKLIPRRETAYKLCSNLILLCHSRSQRELLNLLLEIGVQPFFWGCDSLLSPALELQEEMNTGNKTLTGMKQHQSETGQVAAIEVQQCPPPPLLDHNMQGGVIVTNQSKSNQEQMNLSSGGNCILSNSFGAQQLPNLDRSVKDQEEPPPHGAVNDPSASLQINPPPAAAAHQNFMANPFTDVVINDVDDNLSWQEVMQDCPIWEWDDLFAADNFNLQNTGTFFP